MSKLTRIVRHALHPKGRARRVFSADDLAEIAQACALAKQHQHGQIRLVVENAMSSKRLARGTSPQKRSLEMFAKHHLWDTELNDGIMIFALLADRHVAVLADRGIDRKVAPDTWKETVKVIEAGFRRDAFREGVIDGIAFLMERLPERDPTEVVHHDLSVVPIVI
jgi:uncharacterized membrane protein